MFLRLSNRLQLTYYFAFVRFELFTKLQLKPNWKISFNETKNWQTICLKIKLKKLTFSLPNNYFIKKLFRFLFLKQCQKNDLPYKFGICPINASFFLSFQSYLSSSRFISVFLVYLFVFVSTWSGRIINNIKLYHCYQRP